MVYSLSLFLYQCNRQSYAMVKPRRKTGTIFLCIGIHSPNLLFVISILTLRNNLDLPLIKIIYKLTIINKY